MASALTCSPRRIVWLALLALCAPGGGCRQVFVQHDMHRPQPRLLSPPPPHDALTAPRELHKAVLPEYIIEPPDVLVIDGVYLVPQPSYEFRSGDQIAISVDGTPTDEPIQGVFPVDLGGRVHLGGTYGSVKLAGLTAAEAQKAIEEHLLKSLRSPVVTVSLATFVGGEQIAGPHLVAPDGQVTLGSYGSVSVVGLTKAEAKEAIEAHLSQYLDQPEVSVDVQGYNSKLYYVVTQGAGLGDAVFSFPSTGNETVLDAISQISGLAPTSSTSIWIARPGKSETGCDQVMPVDWYGVTKRGNVATNYQVLPGDRIYVAEDRLVAFDNQLAKIIAPIERLMGFTLLGAETATRLSGNVLEGGGNPIGRGAF